MSMASLPGPAQRSAAYFVRPASSIFTISA